MDYSNESETLGRNLVGRMVTELYVGTGEAILRFHTLTSDVYWGTDGDCCSETWFADIYDLKYLIGHTVLSIHEVEQDDPHDGRSRQECDQLVLITIVTDAGQCRIYWRNSSNGYYGGSVYALEDPYPDTVWTKVEGPTWQAPEVSY